jgi:hypothetical protein
VHALWHQRESSRILTWQLNISTVTWHLVPLNRENNKLFSMTSYHASIIMYKYCYVSGVPWRVITGFELDDWIYWHFFTITTNYNSSQSVTVYDSLHSLMDYECLLFCRNWLGSDLRIGHFFSFRCPLVNTPQLNTELLLRNQSEWVNSLRNEQRVWV